MKLTKDAEVFSSEGEKVGFVERVVIDPDSMKVTHFVVKKGGLFSTDKVVPIRYLSREVNNRITLTETAEELDDLPPYDESSYVSFNRKDYPMDYLDIDTDTNMKTVYWYPPINIPWWAMGRSARKPKPEFVNKEKIIPSGTVALEEGAKVISRDRKTIGTMEQVIVEADETHATHIVIGSGLIAKEYKLVPTLWIKDVLDDKVYLTVRSDFFDQLPEHELA